MTPIDWASEQSSVQLRRWIESLCAAVRQALAFNIRMTRLEAAAVDVDGGIWLEASASGKSIQLGLLHEGGTFTIESPDTMAHDRLIDPDAEVDILLRRIYQLGSDIDVTSVDATPGATPQASVIVGTDWTRIVDALDVSVIHPCEQNSLTTLQHPGPGADAGASVSPGHGIVPMCGTPLKALSGGSKTALFEMRQEGERTIALLLPYRPVLRTAPLTQHSPIEILRSHRKIESLGISIP